MTKKNKNYNQYFSIIIIIVSSLIQAGPVRAGDLDNSISWAGCGITKKAFMADLAAAYQEKTGIMVNLHGGGATRGIRDTVNKKIDMGGSCRMNLPDNYRPEFHAELHPVHGMHLSLSSTRIAN